MNPELVSVVLIKDSVIEENHVFIGEHGYCMEKAEAKFLDLCQTNISNWDEHSQVDIGNILENGYYEFGNGNSVCLSWPDVYADEGGANEVEVNSGTMVWEDGNIRFINTEGEVIQKWIPSDKEYDLCKSTYFPDHTVKEQE